MSDVVARMRAMADGVYSSTEAALYREGANEVDRLTRELDAAEAQARGAQYREREARNEAAMLRAALGVAQGECDEAENAVENLTIARTIGPRFDEVARALAIAGERERCAQLCDAAAARWFAYAPGETERPDGRVVRGNEASALAAEIRGAQAQPDAGDLAGLGASAGR